MLRGSACRRPAICCIGAARAPAKRASSTSRGGRSASAARSAGREERSVGQPALNHEERVVPGEVPQGLGHGADVALHEGQRARAAEVLRQRLVLAAVDGPPDQRVLEDPVVAPGGGQRGAQLGQLGRRQAAVLAHDGGRRRAHARLDLVDDLDLVCHLCVLRCHRCPPPGSMARKRARVSGVRRHGQPDRSGVLRCRLVRPAHRAASAPRGAPEVSGVSDSVPVRPEAASCAGKSSTAVGRVPTGLRGQAETASSSSV